jgi:hypothetical protein
MMPVDSLNTKLNSLISHHNYQIVFYVRSCIYPKLHILGEHYSDRIFTPWILHLDCDTLPVNFIQTQTAGFCGHGHEESRLASLRRLADAWPQGDLWVRARTVRGTFSNYTPMGPHDDIFAAFARSHLDPPINRREVD